MRISSQNLAFLCIVSSISFLSALQVGSSRMSGRMASIHARASRNSIGIARGVPRSFSRLGLGFGLELELA
jgi:hypothetical protein